jgi:hypothetical protein
MHAFPRFLSLAAILAACTGCASIVSGTNQSVSITTAGATGDDVAGAKCTLVNDKGSWYATTPSSVTVHRSYNELAVTCTLDGHQPGIASVKSATKGMAAGNILFGGIIGVGVDMSTGAAYDYPNLIRVSMGQLTGPAGSAANGVAGTLPVVAKAAPGAPVPSILVIAVGTRLSFADSDPVSNSLLGETSYVVSSLEPGGAMSFNDGSIVLGIDGSPTKGALQGAMIYGTGPAQLRRGGSWSGRFRAPPMTLEVPVEISAIGSQTKVVSGRSFQAMRLRLEGYSSREPVTIGSAAGAPFSGEMLVDTTTGLVLEMKVRSRHPSYNVQRELVRIAGN